MFSTLVNAWKIKDIRTKMLYTMLLIVIYRLGSFIPVPGVNAAAITQYAEQYDMLGFLNLLSGGAFRCIFLNSNKIRYIDPSVLIRISYFSGPRRIGRFCFLCSPTGYHHRNYKADRQKDRCRSSDSLVSHKRYPPNYFWCRRLSQPPVCKFITPLFLQKQRHCPQC